MAIIQVDCVGLVRYIHCIVCSASVYTYLDTYWKITISSLRVCVQIDMVYKVFCQQQN